MKYDQASVKRGGQMIGVHPGVIISWDPFQTGINIRGGRRGFSQLFRISTASSKTPRAQSKATWPNHGSSLPTS